MDTALALEEIRTLIGAHLSMKDIQSCCLVNHEWNLSFTPFLWETISFWNSELLPPRLAQNTHHIQHLELGNDFTTDVFLLGGLTRLREIVVSLFSGQSPTGRPPQVQAALATFLREQCSAVRSIHLLHSDQESMFQYYEALKIGCRQLQSLTVSTEVMPAAAFHAIWSLVCSTGLTSLTLESFGESDSISPGLSWSKSPPDSQISKIRRIKLESLRDVSEAHILSILLRCPNLEDLDCDSPTTLLWEEFCRSMEGGAWKTLHSLQGQIFHLPDSQLATILQKMARIQKLSLQRSLFGPASFEALASHAHGLSTLQYLDLVCCCELTSKMIQKILEGAPRLERFYTSRTALAYQDVVEGKPWSCTSTLKNLILRFLVSCGEEVQEDLASRNKYLLERISTLSKLQQITTVSGGSNSSGDNYLWFDLKSGLDCLQSLTDLKKVTFEMESQSMGLEDLDWMTRNWHRLQWLHIRLPKEVRIPPEQTRESVLRGLCVVLY